MAKIIHFCWFGPELPAEIRSRIYRWKKFHPDWKLRKWDESNIEVKDCPYAVARLKERQWAFLSDYVRLQALWLEGGVYLDADVEILKPLDIFLDNAFHIGYMHNCALGTAVMASPAQHRLLGSLIRQYQRLPADQAINNNAILTEFFLRQVDGFRLSGRAWSSGDVSVHPKTWFEQPTLSKVGGFGVHLFNRAWDPNAACALRKGVARTTFLFVVRRRIRCFYEELRCVYFPFFLRDRFFLRFAMRLKRRKWLCNSA